MAPVVHGLEAKYTAQMHFSYLDIDDSNASQFKQALGFLFTPHIFLLDPQGNIIEQWLGPVQEAELESAILNALQ